MAASLDETEAFRSTLNLNTRAPPDFKIKLEDYEWQVHSRIFSRESKFFEAVCNGKFKEADEQSVTLHDDCPWIIARMIRWIYTKCLGDNDRDDPSSLYAITLDSLMCQGSDRPTFQEGLVMDRDRPEWQILLMLYKVADKYAISTLTLVTKRHLSILLTESAPKKVASMFKGVLTSLKSLDLLSDESLCKTLLVAAFLKVPDVAELNDEIAMVYRSHREFLQFSSSILAQLLKHNLKHKRWLRDAIDSILDELGSCSKATCAAAWCVTKEDIEDTSESALSKIRNDERSVGLQ